MKTWITELWSFLSAGLRGRAPLPWRDVLSMAFAAAVLVLAELAGRQSESEFEELGIATVLLLVLALCSGWHRAGHIHWTRAVTGAARRIGRFASSLGFQWGLDLRGTPPVAWRLPPLLWLAPVAASAVILGMLAAALGGVTIRSLVAPLLCTLYIAGLAALWAALLLAVAWAILSAAWTFSDTLRTATTSSWAGAARIVKWFNLGFVLLTLACALLLPVWVAVVISVVTLAASIVATWLPPAGYPGMLWRSDADQPAKRFSLGWFLALQWLMVVTIPLALVALALGPETFGLSPIAGAPVNRFFGVATAWSSAFGQVVFLGLLNWHLWHLRRRDPAVDVPTTLHLAGLTEGQLPAAVKQAIRARGWRLQFAPDEPQRSDVRLECRENDGTLTLRLSRGDEEPPAADATLDSERPLDADFIWRVERRDVIQRRRHLTRGLRKIFRGAARQRTRAGTGYWVAPHLWFFGALTRDSVDDHDTQVLDIIPPYYHRVITLAALSHFYDVCRALEIDLIYLEDGIGYRGLRRVLRVMFERYDIDGGQQPLREIHFAGLPKIRVVIHDFTLDEPLKKDRYPEPDYRNLSRGRILHVFRDRGGEDETDDTPATPEHELTPVGV